jgi:hypothetical protein
MRRGWDRMGGRGLSGLLWGLRVTCLTFFFPLAARSNLGRKMEVTLLDSGLFAWDSKPRSVNVHCHRLGAVICLFMCWGFG